MLPCFCAVCVSHIFLNIVDVFSSSCLAWCGTDLAVVGLDPHGDPHAEINGNGWILPDRKFQPFFVLDPHSHDLVHEISHLFCGLLLLLAGCVGVSAEGESRIVVAQHTADGFYVYAIL